MKTSWWRGLLDAWTRPIQVMVIDGKGSKSARHFRLRPATIMLVAALSLLAAFLAGVFLGPGSSLMPMPQYTRLQNDYQLLKDKLLEANAVLSLKDKQIDGMQAEIGNQREINERLSERVHMFETILEARKTSGVHVLHAHAYWQGKDVLIYSMTLVKGGNYPRRVAGTVQLTAFGPDGEEVLLALDNEQTELPYRMETHTFLQGTVHWAETWRPNRLMATIYDTRGREKAQAAITITGDAS